MTSARYIIGDTRDVVAAMPDGSVDLIMTSPPFLALRSYLPTSPPSASACSAPSKRTEHLHESLPAVPVHLLVRRCCCRRTARHRRLPGADTRSDVVTSPVAKAWQARHPDLSVRLTHRLTPDDVERILDALMVDDLVIVTVEGHQCATTERIKAALCGGSEEDYR